MRDLYDKERSLYREVASRVETITRAEPGKRTLRFYADAAMHLVDPLPYAVGKYRSAASIRRPVSGCSE